MFQKSIAAAAALAVAGFAHAQVGGTTDDKLVDLSGLSVKIGIGIPIESSLRDGIGSGLTSFGVEFQPTRSLLRNSETYFSAEIFLRDYSASRGYVLPVFVNQRFYNSQVVTANVRRQYLFVGIGFAFTDADDNGGTGGALALRGGVGTEVGERLFFEAALMVGGGDDNVRPNLVSISAGYRF